MNTTTEETEIRADLRAARAVYPSAWETRFAIDRVLEKVMLELGLAPNRIMFADSVCCDDLNAIEFPSRAFEMLGTYKLGGLNGFPFAGLTGMGTFANQAPHDGAAFIFHAPHVGVSSSGLVGRIRRAGDVTYSACCGAMRLALDTLELGGRPPTWEFNELDYQQRTLEQILGRERSRVLSASEPTTTAAEVTYEAIERRIDLLVSRTWYPCRHLILLGGILINGDHGIGSFCDIRRFVHLDLVSGTQTDWFASTFAS